jgi:hypothetical protein
MLKTELPVLDPPRTVALVGAGISVPSGIASGQMFVDAVIPQLIPEEMRTNRLVAPLIEQPISTLLRLIRFEGLVEILRNHLDTRLTIMQYLETSWKPSALHYWAVQHVSKGGTVLTTNLDSLIELAFYELFGQSMPQCITDEDYSEFVRMNWDRPRLFKLHGSLRSGQYVAVHAGDTEHDPFADLNMRLLASFGVTLDAVGALRAANENSRGRFTLPEVVTAALKRVLQNKDLLIVGYSGSDDFDVMPTIWELRGVLRRLIWVQHRPESGEIRIRASRGIVLLKGDSWSILRHIFPDTTACAISEGSRIAQPQVTPRSLLDQFLSKWARLVNLTQARKYLVAGQLLASMGKVSNGIAVWEYGLAEADTRATAREIRICLGNRYFDEGLYVESEETYEDVLFGPFRGAVDHSQFEALIGWATVSWFSCTILDKAKPAKRSLKVLLDFVNIGDHGREFADLEVLAGLRACRILRAAHPIGPPDQREQLLQRLSGWRFLFSQKKFLYTLFLRESILYELAIHGETAKYSQWIAELIELLNRLNLRFSHALFLKDLSEICFLKDRLEDSHGHAIGAAKIFKSIRYGIGLADSEVLMALAVADKDQLQAGDLLRRSLGAFAEYHMNRRSRAVEAVLGFIAHLAGDPVASRAHFQKALEYRDSMQPSFNRGLRRLRLYGYMRFLMRNHGVGCLPKAWINLRDFSEEGLGNSDWLGKSAMKRLTGNK